MTSEQKKLLIYMNIVVAGIAILIVAYVFLRTESAEPVEEEQQEDVSVSSVLNAEGEEFSLSEKLLEEDLNTFAKFALDSGVLSELENDLSNYTIFVPLNSAIESTQFSGEESVEFIRKHVTLDDISISDLAGDLTARTLSGSELSFSSSNGVIFVRNGEVDVKVLKPDLKFKNGRLYVLDGAL